MKIYIILVFTIILSFSTNAQCTEITADTTYYNNSAFFFNSDTGIVVSFQGIIQKTHDGGLTWDTTFNFNLFNSRCIHFPIVDGDYSNIGYIGGTDGHIFKTYDFGEIGII